MAVLPSADSATEMPCRAASHRAGADQLGALLGPDPAAAREHPRRPDAAVVRVPPTMAVLPSADSATEKPCWDVPTAPVPTSLVPAGSRRRRCGCTPTRLRRYRCRQTRRRWRCCHRRRARRKIPVRPFPPRRCRPAWCPAGSTRLRCACTPTRLQLLIVVWARPTMAVLPSADSATEKALVGVPHRRCQCLPTSGLVV